MSDRQSDVVLSCRNLWKVYGPHPERFFDHGNGDVGGPEQVAAKLAEIHAAGHIAAAANVSFDLHKAEIFVVMGLSGSGKSTVVRAISRLVDATAGEVLLEGRDIQKLTPRELIEVRRHKMGMVFQAFGLMPHLNVIDNIAFPLKLQGMDEARRLEAARRVIALVGLEGREASFPDELSGGQQQRVGIARSLAVEPDIWLLDEPFSALDPLIRRQMQDEFLRIQESLAKSIVFITHDFLEAIRIADRIMIMKDGQVVQIGTAVDLILNPADAYVREFVCDVPWEFALRARDVMRPAPRIWAGTARVDADARVADILALLARHPEGVAVTGDSGQVLGLATAQGVIEALATGAEEAPR